MLKTPTLKMARNQSREKALEKGHIARTGVPGGDVEDAHAEDGKEPEQDDGREQVAQHARAQALERVQQHQHRAADADHRLCARPGRVFRF